MTIQVSMPALTNANRVGEWYYQVKEFLKLNGWTVAGSSDGTVGGMDAVDRITTITTIDDVDTWIVLQSPHATPADRIQILFAKTSSNVSNALLVYCPEADYSGSGTAVPTSATAFTIFTSTTSFLSANARLTILADNFPPYGWACIAHPLFNITSTPLNGMAFIPLDVTVNADNPGKPYVVYASNSNAFRTQTLSTNSEVTTTAKGVAQGDNTTLSFCAPACTVEYVSGAAIFPEGAIQDPSSGSDPSSPIIFQNSVRFYGQTSFMRWNGLVRQHLQTLSEGIVPRARIVFGHVSFPWDGTTTPLT